MNRSNKYFLATLLVFISICQAACFKKEFPKVGPPDDIDLADTVTAPADSNTVRRVLVIGIDGCRADAMKAADAPNILGLLKNAVYSFDAQTHPPTLSGPGWSSMLTGVWGEKHGVTDNTFEGRKFDQFPSLYKYINRLSPSKVTESIVAWNPINDFIAVDATKKIDLSENDQAVKDSAVHELNDKNPDVLFLHFDQVDAAGHQYGFSPTVSDYMSAIHHVDGLVGDVLSALKTRTAAKNEDWLIIISTDHGGIGTSHGGSSDEEKNIFTIFYNKKFASRNVVPPPSVLKAIDFTNTGAEGGSYASLNDYYNFDSLPKLSFQFEIKTAQLSSDVPFLTNKNWASGANPGFVFNIRSQSWKINIADGTRRVDVNATGVPNLNDNLWHTLTITLDRGGDVILYQDGLKCGSTSMAGLTNIKPATSAIKLAINQDITGIYSKSNFSMSNIKIWSDVLDPIYIAQPNCDTSLSSSDAYKDKLLSWWKCNDGVGDRFRDSGPGAYDFQLAGAPVWSVQSVDFCNNALSPSVPTMVDIMPTLMSWLGYSVDYTSWQLDGRSWLP